MGKKNGGYCVHQSPSCLRLHIHKTDNVSKRPTILSTRSDEIWIGSSTVSRVLCSQPDFVKVLISRPVHGVNTGDGVCRWEGGIGHSEGPETTEEIDLILLRSLPLSVHLRPRPIRRWRRDKQSRDPSSTLITTVTRSVTKDKRCLESV